jgi:hypothetical protein
MTRILSVIFPQNLEGVDFYGVVSAAEFGIDFSPD